jgi:hypothetical protein
MANRPHSATILSYSALFAAALLLLLATLYYLGAFQAEFGAPDEAAHLVSGIMIFDYLRHGLFQSPLAFAQNYYNHYPKVAIGHWPPVFYSFEALWFLFFGVSRISAVVFTAFATASLSLLTAILCRAQKLSWPLTTTTALVVVLLPQTLTSTLELSSDPLTAAFALAAVMACQCWLSRQTISWGIKFVLLASLAVLVKGNAFPIYLIPFAVFPYRLWLQPLFFIPISLIVLLPLPWYWSSREIAIAEILPGQTTSLLSRILYTARFNTLALFSLSGPLMPVLTLVSLLRKRWSPLWPALLALPAAYWFFLSFLSPHTDPRLMIAIIPVFCLGAALAFRSSAVLLLALLAAHLLQPVRPKPQQSFVPAVAWATKSLPPSTFLIASNYAGEGSWISELALHQPTPQSTILRATKLLQSSTWMSGNVKLLANSPEEAKTILQAQKVQYVVLHTNPRLPIPAYQSFLLEATRDWPLLATFKEIQIYKSPF